MVDREDGTCPGEVRTLAGEVRTPAGEVWRAVGEVRGPPAEVPTLIVKEISLLTQVPFFLFSLRTCPPMSLA